jgi:uncharacterized membrane protein (UPF0127 family)
MKRAWIASLPLVAWLVLVGCDKPNARSSAPPAPPGPTGPQEAQPRLPTVKLWVGAHELNTEIALDRRQVETGMMFRTNITDAEGMLFVFAAPHQASFWMKNVPIPLSCAYLDAEGVILEIHDMRPQDTNPIVAGTSRVQFVLETAQGWFGRHQVSTGALLRTELGSLRETFLGRPRRPPAAPGRLP